MNTLFLMGTFFYNILLTLYNLENLPVIYYSKYGCVIKIVYNTVLIILRNQYNFDIFNICYSFVVENI